VLELPLALPLEDGVPNEKGAGDGSAALLVPVLLD
jgi:hypothetical protein